MDKKNVYFPNILLFMHKTGYIFFIVFVLLFTQEVFADFEVGERTVFSFDVDKEGETNPDIFIPVNWTKNGYSGIGYTSSKTQDDGEVTGFAESRIVTAYEQSIVKLNLYTHEMKLNKLSFSVGGIIDYITIDRLELGYIHFPETLGNDWVSFENDVNIKVLKPEIEGIIGKRSSNFSIRGIFSLAPSSRLSVEQTTRFKPIIPNDGKGSSDTQQNLSYKISVEMLFKTVTFLDIGIVASREFFPMKYKVQTLDYDSNTKIFGFQTSDVEVEEITYKISLRALFNNIDIGGMNPAVGYGYESTTGKDVLNNQSETEDNNFIVIGIEKRF